MADIITPILNIVSVLCGCSANNRCCYLLDLQENKQDLNNALLELRAIRDGVKIRVDEAENNPNQKCTPEVERWLEDVQTIDEEMVQVIQNADEEVQGRCFGGNCPRNCWSACKIGKLVLRKLSIVNNLKSKGGLFVDVAYKLPPPPVQEEPMNTTVGMGPMFDKVWRLLAEDEVRIMGLYGIGGVGKTTLLKQINNEFLKTTTTTTTTTSSLHGFDVVILVVVSKVINIGAIQKEIGKRLGLSLKDRTDKTRIFNALTKKNFVLLLDDLWEGVDLQSIGIPPSLENKKSKVIFTTRSEIGGHMEANEMLKVECLPLNEAWILFQEKVGERALNSFPSARELAKVAAEKCGGLPLALITIGRVMSAKKTVQEWNHAITKLRRAASELPGMGEAVFPLLKVSYDSLGNDTIKSCFLYCALFPEDESIRIQKLVDYWIGEGFISLSDNIDEARNHGYDVIGILKGACLLESGGDEEEYEVKMHDTIRGMALWITRECGSSERDKLLIIDEFDCTSERLWYNAQRICFKSFRRDETEVSTLESPNLLTLIHKGWGSSSFIVPQNFFEYMPHLRVLDLTHCMMRRFPTSITGLLELQYLSLSHTNIEALPEELGKLVNLKYLDLSNMHYLMKIPSGVIGSLLELRVLNLYNCLQADWDLDEVCKLKHLNDFGVTIETQHNLNKLLSNTNLQMCTRGLILVGKEPFWFGQQRDLLQFPNMGIEQQQHLGSFCFQNLSKIEIWKCNGLKDLTWVGYVPNLKKLQVLCCNELEEIVVIVVDDDFGGSTRGGGGRRKKVDDIFKSLKTLELRNLPKLKSICRNALAFPCLKSLQVERCPELKKLPFNSGSNVNNTLREIEGGRRWWRNLQWEEEDHNNNNNNNNELLKSKFLPYFLKNS